MTLLACTVPWTRVRAEPPLATCTRDLGADQAHALLARIEPELASAQRGARIWFGGWLATYAALTAASAAFAAAPGLEPEWRDSNLWSAASAGLALVLLIAPPLPTLSVERALGPRSRRNERERLGRALALIDAGAAQEQLLRSGTAQVANAAIALAQGLYLGLRYDQGDGAKAAAANAVGSWLVGEAQILTSPRALSALQAALVREGAACVKPPPPPPSLAFQLLIGPRGLGARLRF